MPQPPETGTQAAGLLLKEARQAQNLTLRQVAALAGVDHSMLSKVERGEQVASRRWLRAVTEALGRHRAEMETDGDAA